MPAQPLVLAVVLLFFSFASAQPCAAAAITAPGTQHPGVPTQPEKQERIAQEQPVDPDKQAGPRLSDQPEEIAQSAEAEEAEQAAPAVGVRGGARANKNRRYVPERAARRGTRSGSEVVRTRGSGSTYATGRSSSKKAKRR